MATATATIDCYLAAQTGTLPGAFRLAVRTEGVSALYRGQTATLLREGFGHRGAPLEWYERVLDPSLSEKGLRDSTRDALFEVWVPDLIRRRGVPQLSTRALEVLLTDGGAYYRDRAVEQLLDTGDPGARRLQQLASNASPHLRRALAHSIRRPGLDPPRRLQRELERELEGETP